MRLSPSTTFSTTLNTILHIVILWTFLIVFFFVYISTITREALQKEIGKFIDSGMDQSFKSLNPEEKQYVSTVLQNVPLENLIAYYSQSNDAIELNNMWLLVISIMVSGSFILLFIGMTFAIKMGSKANVSLKEIFVENFFTFLFVGAVEVVFFLFIAFKFVPVLPSTAIKTIAARLKKNFDPSNAAGAWNIDENLINQYTDIQKRLDEQSRKELEDRLDEESRKELENRLKNM